MTSRELLVLALVAYAGCVNDVPTLDVMTTARTATALMPPDDHIPMGLGRYRWDLVEVPDGGNEVGPYAGLDTASITITPPVHGIYVFDRWFVGQAADQLSYRVVVTASSAAPLVTLTGPARIQAGEIATFDGNASRDLDGGTLTFQWRLAVRPEGSTTELPETTMATTSLLTDVVGEYTVELRVMAGGVWSQPGMAKLSAY